jgi:hypothetical protein
VVALGEHGHVIHGLFGSTKHGFRQAPDWIAPITHPLIALLVVPATLLWSRRHGTTASSPDLLLLLALLMLARCVLDVANNGYYHLPFLIALVAWETLQRERPPVLSLIASALVWLTVVKLPNDISPDAQCAAYLAWTLPALAALAFESFRTPRSAGRRTTARASLVRAHA